MIRLCDRSVPTIWPRTRVGRILVWPARESDGLDKPLVRFRLLIHWATRQSKGDESG